MVSIKTLLDDDGVFLCILIRQL